MGCCHGIKLEPLEIYSSDKLETNLMSSEDLKNFMKLNFNGAINKDKHEMPKIFNNLSIFSEDRSDNSSQMIPIDVSDLPLPALTLDYSFSSLKDEENLN